MVQFPSALDPAEPPGLPPTGRWECVNCPGLLAASVRNETDSRGEFFWRGPLVGNAYGWGGGPLAADFGSTQSWRYCPLISLGLLAAERRRGFTEWSTGNRRPVPDDQIAVWHGLPAARLAISMCAEHFMSL